MSTPQFGDRSSFTPRRGSRPQKQQAGKGNKLKGSGNPDPVFAAEMAAVTEARQRAFEGDFAAKWAARLERGVKLPPELQPSRYVGR